MQFSTLSTLAAAFLLCTHPAGSAPAPPLLSPRADYCANAPKVVAGTFLPARSLPLHPRVPPPVGVTRWCARGSRTYIYVTLTTAIAGPAIQNLLDAAFRFSEDYILLMGDGVVPADGMNYIPVDGYRVTFANTNNHQITWGVYGAALMALRTFMAEHGWGAAVFKVVDGANAVATGVVTPVPHT